MWLDRGKWSAVFSGHLNTKKKAPVHYWRGGVFGTGCLFLAVEMGPGASLVQSKSYPMSVSLLLCLPNYDTRIFCCSHISMDRCFIQLLLPLAVALTQC